MIVGKSGLGRCILPENLRRRHWLGPSADRKNPQTHGLLGLKPEVFVMRNIIFATIATLAVAFGSLAASAEPRVGDGSTMDRQSTVLSYAEPGG